MKFIDKHPDAEPWAQFESGGDDVVKGEEPAPCAECREPTLFYSISFQAPFCSEEHLAAMWDGYFEALRSGHADCDDGLPW